MRDSVHDRSLSFAHQKHTAIRDGGRTEKASILMAKRLRHRTNSFIIVVLFVYVKAKGDEGVNRIELFLWIHLQDTNTYARSVLRSPRSHFARALLASFLVPCSSLR